MKEFDEMPENLADLKVSSTYVKGIVEEYNKLLSLLSEKERQLESSQSIQKAEKEILIKEIELNKEKEEKINSLRHIARESGNVIEEMNRLIEEKEKKIEVWKDLYEEYKQLWNEGEIRIKELEKLISDGVLKDHDGCQIYRDEEYTKLESQFREKEKEIEIEELEKIISKKDDRIIQLVQDVNEADGMHMAELEKKWDLNNKIEKLETKIKELEEVIGLLIDS